MTLERALQFTPDQIAIFEHKGFQIFFDNGIFSLEELLEMHDLRSFFKMNGVPFNPVMNYQLRMLSNKYIAEMVKKDSSDLAMLLRLDAAKCEKLTWWMSFPEIRHDENRLMSLLPYTPNKYLLMMIAMKRENTSEAGARKYLEKGWLKQEEFDGLTGTQKASFNITEIRNDLDAGKMRIADVLKFQFMDHIRYGHSLFVDIPFKGRIYY